MPPPAECSGIPNFRSMTFNSLFRLRLENSVVLTGKERSALIAVSVEFFLLTRLSHDHSGTHVIIVLS